MLPRLHIAPAIALALSVALALPAAAAAGGGTSPEDPAAQDGSVSVREPGPAILGRTMTFRGSAVGNEGATAVVQRLDRARGWTSVARGRVDGEGRFRAPWRTDHSGRFSVRAVVRDEAEGRASASPRVRATVYRQSIATWYGPGFYGRRTACGQTMSRTLQGVAHKTLPCGSRVGLLYRGRTVVVPVVDRGPYANNATWDLTVATARRLGFEYTDRIGAVVLSKPRG